MRVPGRMRILSGPGTAFGQMSMKVEEPPQTAGGPGRCVTRASQRPIYSAAKVLCVPPAAVQPPLLLGGTQGLFRLLAQGSEMAGVPRLGVIEFTCGCQLFNAVFPDRFEHEESRAAVRYRDSPEQALVDQ